jgi:FMN phosphatase YigB (HAD superfamily)
MPLDNIAVVSFDLDGTLVDDAFDQEIWFQEIPRRYADKHGLGLDQARERVVADYRSLRGIPRWTDLAFWFERFDLGDWEPAARSLTRLIRAYPETVEVLEALALRYRLIIVTQAEPKFYGLKFEVTGLRRFFERIYSTPERFSRLAKDADVYAAILSELGVEGEWVLHVGDHPRHDFETPRSLGIRTLLLDRSGEESGDHVIRDLRELLPLLSGTGGEGSS